MNRFLFNQSSDYSRSTATMGMVRTMTVVTVVIKKTTGVT